MSDPFHNAIELRIDLDPHIYFAMQQNDVSVIKAVHVENRGEGVLRDLEFKIVAEPSFAQACSIQIASVAPQSVYNVERIALELSPAYLGELTERIRGQLRFELRHEGALLAERNLPIELLARDESEFPRL